MNSATLKDLKLVIKKKVNEIEQSQMGHRHISWYSYSILSKFNSKKWFFDSILSCCVLIGSLSLWWICRKHVWANFCLAHHNEKLLDDSSALQDFGIRNNSQVICPTFYELVDSFTSRIHLGVLEVFSKLKFQSIIDWKQKLVAGAFCPICHVKEFQKAF